MTCSVPRCGALAAWRVDGRGDACGAHVDVLACGRQRVALGPPVAARVACARVVAPDGAECRFAAARRLEDWCAPCRARRDWEPFRDSS